MPTFSQIVRGGLAAVALTVLLGGNIGAGCSMGSKVSSIDVPMEYKPRTADTPVVRTPTGQPLKIFVSPTNDKRADTRTIGSNTQDDTPIPVYAAGKSVADFVTEVLKQEMTTAGLEVTDDATGNQRQVDSEIVQFSVNEGGSYKAIVQIRVKVIDATGKVLWQGMGPGDASNWGRSKKAENYQQAYSSALRVAINKILADSKFVEAVSGGQQ